jgi:UDP-N-acetylmuramate dehydrogenase
MIQENISLQPYNTFGINATARYFARFSTVEALQELLTPNAKTSPNNSPLPTPNSQLLLLGGGSNMLFTGDYNGLVLKNELKGIKLLKEDDEHYYVKVNAGENWHGFVQYCIAHGYAGVENLSLIPGCAGASPMQNIGAYGVEIKDVFESLEALEINTKEIVTFTNSDCAFGYRESVFKHKYKNQFIILNVTFRLRKQPAFNTSYGAIEQELEQMGVQTLSIKAISEAVIRIRSSKLPDPAQIGNAGSFFKNPTIPATQFEALQQQYPAMPHYPVADTAFVKIPAGWLIEQCGWKGYRNGDAGCHAKQALVLVNYGHATGNEIYRLSEQIITSIQDKYGITLEREVNMITAS